jgi:hypothetical protein
MYICCNQDFRIEGLGSLEDAKRLLTNYVKQTKELLITYTGNKADGKQCGSKKRLM